MSNAKLHALVVDDDNITRRAHQVMLEQVGFEVICAENGAEAIQLSQQHFDLICIDIDMPVMDGVTATAAIRRQTQNKSTYIIGLSTHNDIEHKNACLAAGMNILLTKPAQLNTLLPLISKVLA